MIGEATVSGIFVLSSKDLISRRYLCQGLEPGDEARAALDGAQQRRRHLAGEEDVRRPVCGPA